MATPAADPEAVTAAVAPRRLPAIPRIWLVAGGGWIGRGVQILCQLAAVRILTDNLGTTGYGVFAVLASLTGWFALSDFSIAISLQNYISERRASERATDDIILTASVLALGASCVVAVLMLLLGPWLSALLLDEFQFMTGTDRTLAFYAMAFPGIGTALGSVLYKIWFAHHRGYLSNLVPAAGTVLGTLAVWAVARLHIAPALPWSVLVFYAPLGLLPVILLAITASRIARHHRLDGALVAPLMQRALRFWIFGLLAASVLQVDFIIMAQVLPPDDIVIYSIATRIFGLIFFVYNALLLALWPVCSEAIVRHQWSEVFALVRKYVTIGLALVTIGGAGAALTAPWIVRILAPSSHVVIPLSVIGLLTAYFMLRIWADTFAMVLQSMNDLKALWIIVPVQSLLSMGLQTLGARWFGLEGVIIGLILCFLLTVVWVLPLRCVANARRTASKGTT